MTNDKWHQIAAQRIEKARQAGSTELDLCALGLSELPSSITSLTEFQYLYLEENPLNPDLAAAYDQSFEAVRQYLRAAQQVTLNKNDE